MLIAVIVALPAFSAMAGDAEDIVGRVQKIKDSDQFKMDITKAKDMVNKVNKKYQDEEFVKHQIWAKSMKIDSERDKLNIGHLNNNSGLGLLLKSLNKEPEDKGITSVRHYPVMVFVSSSMPQESIKTLMIESKMSGAAMVFRGLVGSLRNTSEFLQKLSKENVSAIIDPRLFDSFNIKSVPTFIVIADSDLDSSVTDLTPRHDRISGNITLKYALETISQGDGVASDMAQNYLSKITTKEGYEK